VVASQEGLSSRELVMGYLTRSLLVRLYSTERTLTWKGSGNKHSIPEFTRGPVEDHEDFSQCS
jgi:hypothetical protein